MSYTVFLGNLPLWVTADDIKSWLAADNLVADNVKVIRNPETQESKGFAFIEAPNQEEMNSIIRRFDRAPLEERLLRANPAQPPKPKGSKTVLVRPGLPGTAAAGAAIASTRPRQSPRRLERQRCAGGPRARKVHSPKSSRRHCDSSRAALRLLAQGRLAQPHLTWSGRHVTCSRLCLACLRFSSYHPAPGVSPSAATISDDR